MGAFNKKIENPRIGYLNLIGADALDLVNEDKKVLGELFSPTIE